MINKMRREEETGKNRGWRRAGLPSAGEGRNQPLDEEAKRAHS